MPLKRCAQNGKAGWKWGDSGKCYLGDEGKKKALRQGVAVEGPTKFSEMMRSEGADINDDDIAYVMEELHAQGFDRGSMIIVASNLIDIDGYSEELTTSNYVEPKPEDYVECDEVAEAAEYQGRKVTLNKPFRLPQPDSKKFGVYVRDPKTKNIKLVKFGSPSMEIRRDDPERRKSFRARHKCDEKKPITSPGRWSCLMWSKKNVSDIT